ncbi:ferrous iron transport protein B [Catalinimonas alkaloidigena]|uniref:Ferrous iron transport protein B n=1 Tax=Catalinimonas alkaloidigena TaxID=1075417 RepID=A0A1G9LYW9_9BACT|nr:ferrous iron transport protein B [Catalinimonas alkaloidigena]SDL66951.1 ferrous iron transport protein B [Catalinimonas alkaloidigena]
MIAQRVQTVALLGNPNAGKSSLFNHLTGLQQKVGNFPGVTVERKAGRCALTPDDKVTLVDLPGTYSLYPKSPEERIVFETLSNPQSRDYPDVVVVVADLTNLKRHLLLFTQVRDLGLPVVLALNMTDLADKIGLTVDVAQLERDFGMPVVRVNGRTGTGLQELKQAILQAKPRDFAPFYEARQAAPEAVASVRQLLHLPNDYTALLYLHHSDWLKHVSEADRQIVADVRQDTGFQSTVQQSRETIARYEVIAQILHTAMRGEPIPEGEAFSEKADAVLTHSVWGYVIFFGLLFLIFQAVFAWASYPQDAIDNGIAALNEGLRQAMPAGPLTDLLTDGIIAGLGGILIFVPQIAILFLFIAILEETGYMSRVVFLMDRIMRRFGLSGRSLVPLISGWACAIPAIMSARTIQNEKERLITIFVTPLMSCSARIPVYTILIALVVPGQTVLGFLNLQGLTLMGLYALGFIAAILSAWVMKKLMKSRERSFFIMELPDYRMPRWKNVGLTVWQKVRTFVWEAGKVIMAISIILWVLASYGPGDAMDQGEQDVRATWETNAPSAHGATVMEQQVGHLTELTPEQQLENAVASRRLEESYAGHLGRAIEPVIRPLGFDWKIGIALITSFAAREVFVGTLSTIYSVGADDSQEDTIRARLKSEINPRTGGPMFTPALAFSLLIFYVFAMQCMSTLAVVKQETNSWRWPLLQLIYMTGLAYLSSFLVYQWLA